MALCFIGGEAVGADQWFMKPLRGFDCLTRLLAAWPWLQVYAMELLVFIMRLTRFNISNTNDRQTMSAQRGLCLACSALMHGNVACEGEQSWALEWDLLNTAHTFCSQARPTRFSEISYVGSASTCFYTFLQVPITLFKELSRSRTTTWDALPNVWLYQSMVEY